MTCSRCQGAGEVRLNPYDWNTCPRCGGTGHSETLPKLPAVVTFPEEITARELMQVCPRCSGDCLVSEETADGFYSMTPCPACAGDGLVSSKAAEEIKRTLKD